MSRIASTCSWLLALLRQEDGWSRVWVGLGMAIAMAGGGLIYYQAQQAGEGEANIWVDTDGGTCARQSPAGGYVGAQACGSLDAAYDAAACDDLILVKGGTYGSDPDTDLEYITGSNTCGTGNEKVLAAADGETPQFGTILADTTGQTCPANGPDNFVLRGFTVIGGVALFGTTNATVDQFDGGSFWINCGSNSTIEDSDWGPCPVGDANDPCRGKALETGDTKPALVSGNGVIIRNNYFHDIYIDPGSGAHAECIQIWNGGDGDLDEPIHNLVIVGNRWHNCETNAISMGLNDNFLTGYVVIANNWFEQMHPNTVNNPLNITSYPMDADIYVVYNSFVQEEGVICEGAPCGGGSGSGAQYLYGNIIGRDDIGGTGAFCATGWTCDYNVYYDVAGSGSLGSNATVLPGAIPYVNSSGGLTSNFHLTGDNTTGIDNALPSGCENWGVFGAYDGKDWDSESRPLNSPNCDAGSDERNQS